MSSAQGIDVSSYQPVLTAATISDYDFLFVKATDGGPMSRDPNFASNWAALQKSGKIRGAYHELSGGSPSAQAALFMSAMTSEGLQDGDMLAVVVSDYPDVDGEKVQQFAGDVTGACKAAKVNCPLIVYSDLSFLPDLGDVKQYALWIADYNPSAPQSVEPWGTWAFWQWTDSPVDKDAFNGTTAQLTAWINGYKKKPAPTPDDPPDPSVTYIPAATQEAIMAALPVLQSGSSDKSFSHQYVKRVQSLCVSIYGHALTLSGEFDAPTFAAVKAVQKAAKVTEDGVVGPTTWKIFVTGAS